MNNISTFMLMSSRDICAELGRRAKRLRLTKNITQKELAERAGLSLGTVRGLELGKSISLENFVQVIDVLGRTSDLETLMVLEQRLSIAQLETLERANSRLRASGNGR